MASINPETVSINCQNSTGSRLSYSTRSVYQFEQCIRSIKKREILLKGPRIFNYQRSNSLHHQLILKGL